MIIEILKGCDICGSEDVPEEYYICRKCLNKQRAKHFDDMIQIVNGKISDFIKYMESVEDSASDEHKHVNAITLNRMLKNLDKLEEERKIIC